MKKLLSLFVAIIFVSSVFAQTTSVKGTVRDAKTNQPLAFATVIVYGTTIGAMSDSLGYYIIDRAPLGFQRLEFSTVGYKTLVSDPVELTSARVRQVDGAMVEDIAQIGAVEVRARGFRRVETPPLSNFRLNVQDIEKSPGGNRDISKVVQNIPGVTATPAYRNDLIVRGGGPSENKFYLDRIEIPIINHFAQQGASGGNASLVNSDFLSSATLFTSAFPVSATGALSSVLDMRMGEGNSEKFKTRFSIGASDAALTIDTPLGDKANLIASYRVSYLQLLFKLIKLPFLPTYQDAQIKLSYHITPKDNLYVIGLGGYDINRLNMSLQNDPNIEPSRRYLLEYIPENDQWSYVAGVVYTRTMENGQLTAVVSRDYVNNSLQKWQDNDPSKGKNLDYVSSEGQYKARVEYAGNLGRGFSITGGVSFNQGSYDNHTFQKIFVGGQGLINQYSSELHLASYAAYVGVDKEFFGEKLRLTLAARIEGNDYSSFTSNPVENFSPRLALSYKFAKKWEFNASLGRFHQAPLYTTMGFRNAQGRVANRDALRFVRSDQVSAGFAFSPTRVSRLSVEGFYKSYDRYPMSLIDSVAIGGRPYAVFAVGAEPVRSVGRGRAYGVEVLYRNADLFGFRINASYTYYRSQFRKLDKNFEPTGEFISSNWDNEHLFTLVLSRTIGKGWEVGLRWRYAGGAPYTPYDVQASMKPEQWNATHQAVLDYSLQNSARLPAFHQLDLRVDKTWYFKKWTFRTYVDIQNLYNYASQGQPLLLPEIDPVTGQYIVDQQTGSYVPRSYSNSLGGAIIPTLGIIIEF